MYVCPTPFGGSVGGVGSAPACCVVGGGGSVSDGIS